MQVRRTVNVTSRGRTLALASTVVCKTTARVAVAISGLMVSSVTMGGTLTCAPYGGGAYCQYKGKVSEAYVNAYDAIHIYFDQTFDVSIPAQVGFNVSSASVAVVPISENPDFAKMFYATLLSAQARGVSVRIQMLSTSGSYFKADRIWVAE